MDESDPGGTGARARDRRRGAAGLALGYPRAGVSLPGRAPSDWETTEETDHVGHGVEAFDRAAGDLHSLAVHARAGSALEPDPTDADVVLVRGGPLRGRCRVVERIDESLRQGLVLGTGVGHRESAEHRCELELDPGSGAVTASVRTVWLPGGDFVLPGGVERQCRGHRRLVARLVRVLRWEAEPRGRLRSA